MHQYELMRLLARMMDVLSDVASGVPSEDRARALRDEIAKTAAQWANEESEFNEAVTRCAD